MSGARIGALALRIVRGFRRDRRSLALLVVVPLVVMALIGYLVGDEREPLRVGVVTPTIDPGGGAAPALAFVEALRHEGTLAVVEVDEASGRTQVTDGDLDGLLITASGPPGPDPTLPPVVVVVRGEDVQVEGPVVQAAARAAAAARGQQVSPGDVPGLNVERIALPGGDRPSTISFAAPALITVFAFLFTFMLTSVAFLRERSSGTLERLLASPILRGEILTGYLLGFLPFAALQATLVLGYAIVILDARNAGSMWLVVVVLLLLVVGVVHLGIALSFFARNELQVVQFIPLVLLPQIFLGGLWWPVQSLWEPLRWVSVLFPIPHAVRALRRVMLGGAAADQITGDLVSLTLFAGAMVVLGLLALRRRRVS